MTARVVIPAHEDHIFYLANHMAEEDRAECEALGYGPYRALQTALDFSVAAWTGMIMPDARPVCMFGVIGANGPLGGVGLPWFLATPELRRHAVRFLKDCDPYLQRMLDIFPVLIEYVDARHARALKWVKWLGFTIAPEPVPFGPLKMPFYRIEKRR